MSPVAFTCLDDYINATKVFRRITKPTTTGEGAGTWHDLYRLAGLPAIGVIGPSLNGIVLARDSTGAFDLPNVDASHNLYLGDAYFAAHNACVVSLYDRLWHNNSLVGNTTGMQTIVTPSLGARLLGPTGDTSGLGVEPWITFNAAIGATATSMGLSYTNHSGVAGRTGVYMHPANAETVNQMAPFALEPPDQGVRSVEGLKLAATSAGGGAMGIILLRPVASFPINVAGGGIGLDPVTGGCPPINNSACLTAMAFCSGTVTPIVQGDVVIAIGAALAP